MMVKPVHGLSCHVCFHVSLFVAYVHAHVLLMRSPSLPAHTGAERDSGAGESRVDTGVCEKNTPPRKARRIFSFKNTKSYSGEAGSDAALQGEGSRRRSVCFADANVFGYGI